MVDSNWVPRALNPIRGYVHLIGSGLSLLGIIFVILKLVEYRDQLDLSGLELFSWVFLCALTLAYGISELTLALAWRHILAYLRVAVSLRWAILTYGVSQLAKYLPGNIFHLAGRQAIGLDAGIAGRPLALSSLFEHIFISVTALIFALLILPISIPSFGSTTAVLVFLVVLLCYIRIASHFFGVAIANTIFLYAVFLSISGLIFAGTYYLVAKSEGRYITAIVPFCGAYVIAWLAGILTPGAPAGVGVRETTLFALLHLMSDQANLLTAILMSRIVTTGGDVLFFLLSSIGKATGKVFPSE